MIELSLFGSRAHQLAGLDISSSSVKLVELSGGDKDGYKVERYAIETLPRDAVVDGNIANLEAVSEAVVRALRRFGPGVRNVAMALPASSVITKKIILPEGLREQEMELAVESEANQYIPFALDEVNLDFQVIGPAPGSPGEVEVLIAASRKDKVEDRVAIAQAAGLKATVVDVESLAIESALELVSAQLPGGGRDKVIALIDVGASVMNVTMLRNRVPVYSREQAFGGNQLTQDISRQYGMSVDDAEAAKRAGTLPEAYARDLMRPFMDSLALEVSRALQFFFTSTQYNQIDHLVLAGGCAIMPGLAQVVGARTQIETVIANPFAKMTLSSKVRPKNLLADAPSLMVACGLALRRFDA
ncbi:MAG: pilus assembly protein PilM [Proteobacteria bacterium]|uniref:pilus assembly protein PilM n=1 Tax=Thauera sp. 2A1 TaxID=2570191 RepID=UPI001291E54C|nr:pilus assembly protein PilM [Thauera sp. 2A1]KAI5914197.1 pilus assembly protein PilM [Thauera sp. 2A1]MBS0513520.1 pilus assembly protein PilM [Pseudomonadota bacterium]MBS0550992.1 pilus assembly protein PilM [Pseudomonadota bacterium]